MTGISPDVSRFGAEHCRNPEFWVGDGSDELHRYLREHIFSQLAPPPYGEIETIPLSTHRPVFLFVERTKGLRAAGKFLCYGPVSLDRAWELVEKEHTNLQILRKVYGMNGRCRVVAPLGKNRELSALLVTEGAPPRSLDHYIGKAAVGRDRDRLFSRLGLLAEFFALLHSNTRSNEPVSVGQARAYFERVTQSLNGFGDEYIDRARREAEQWWKSERLRGDVQVVVHGDATPTNFFFHDDEVIGIDLERMKRADRCWDLSFTAAELKHHFIWRADDRRGSEPFIGHFLWHYSKRLESAVDFRSITAKNPLYMSIGLLRIVRNAWLGEEYRKKLMAEAVQCLKYEP